MDTTGNNETMTFEANGKTYEIAFSMKRIEMYESGRKPVMASFAQNGGTFSVAEMKALIGYGLRAEGGGWVAPKQGMAMAAELIDANGYMAMFEAIAAALERDCGFFFKERETAEIG